MDLFPEKDKKKPEVDTYSYVRSNKALEMKIKDGFDESITEMKYDDLVQVKRLNSLIVELDQMNVEKRLLS